jgi:hypothetical protein
MSKFFMLVRAPVISKKELEKKTTSRGHTNVVFKEDIVLVGLKDNKVGFV